MDIKSYRREQQEQVARARKSRQVYTTPDDLPTKSQANANERAEALRQMQLTSRNLAERIPCLLEVLGRESEPVTVRSAAFEMLATAEFVGRTFLDFRPQLIDAVRKLAQDKSPTLRKQALEYLAQENDDYARDILTEAVYAPEKAPVNQAKAVQLLGLDDHANAADLIRDRFEQLTEQAREEAARIISTDAKSVERLSKMVNDKQVSEKLRRITAAGLKALDVASFERTAREVLVNSSESARLKTALVAMAQTANTKQDQAINLDDAIETARRRTKSKPLKDAAERYFIAQGRT